MKDFRSFMSQRGVRQPDYIFPAIWFDYKLLIPIVAMAV
jgi:hypothetical protein